MIVHPIKLFISLLITLSFKPFDLYKHYFCAVTNS
jgi:hypothetical protein